MCQWRRHPTTSVTEAIVGRPLIRIRETTSTMELAGELAQLSATAGTAVLAGHQTSGRGRTGHAWTAPPGSSILMSFIAYPTRPRAELGMLSLLFGLTVAETVETCGVGPAAIKWPNDVLVDGRKIAGILVATRESPGVKNLSVIAGIGLNVNIEASDLPELATSMTIESGPQTMDAVFLELCDRLTTTLRQFDRGPEYELRDRLDSRLAYRGECVTVEDGPRKVSGRIQGLAGNGALILVSATGEEVHIVAGDVTRGPRPIG